jgi:anti-sigma B factor antagonist
VVLDQIDAGVALLKLEGEHDLSTADALREQLERVQGTRTPVVVDVSDATFIDSSILAALVAAHRRACQERTGLAICTGRSHSERTSRLVERVLDVSGLEEQLEIHPAPEAAIAAAKKGAP